MPKSPAYLVYLWPGRGLVLSSAILATAHKHAALQVTLGLNGPFKLKMKGGDWAPAEAVLLASGASHELDGLGNVQANLYVEPDSQLGRGLAAKFLDGGHFGILPLAPFASLRKAFLQLAQKPAAPAKAYELYTEMALRLAGIEAVAPPVDPRVREALRVFDGLEDKRISAKELAQRIYLSESRLSHLFSEELGLPIKRYLLWLKLLAACQRVNSDDNITRAAQAGGFTDSAHLTHTMRGLLGISPRMLFQNRAFVRVLTGSDPRLS